MRRARFTPVAAVRGWSLWEAPPQLLALFLLTDGIAATLSVLALSHVDGTSAHWGGLALLLVTAFAYEEGSRRAARMKIRLGSPIRPDMASVWTVAAAVALTPGMTVLLASAIFIYDWFRHFRPAGEQFHRKLFVESTILIGCLLAVGAARTVFHVARDLPWRLDGLFGVLAAMAVLELVNRALVTLALVIMGVRGRALLGSASDNLVELATLCLGGLVTLALLYEPWLVVLAVAPMFTLQRGALVRELETAATTDAKTGLLNAIAWEHLAERELARATRMGAPLGVLIIDIDRFKRVNDVFGHLVGDRVLRLVGRAIAAEMREYDGVGRFGGEEFVAVLPQLGAVDAMVVAERVRNRVNQLRVSELVAGTPLTDHDRLSVSIGVSSTEFGAEEVPALLREADVALYQAKETGRNRVVLADPGPASGRDSHPVLF